MRPVQRAQPVDARGDRREVDLALVVVRQRLDFGAAAAVRGARTRIADHHQHHTGDRQDRDQRPPRHRVETTDHRCGNGPNWYSLDATTKLPSASAAYRSRRSGTSAANGRTQIVYQASMKVVVTSTAKFAQPAPASQSRRTAVQSKRPAI